MKLHPCVLSSAAVVALACVVSVAACYYKSRNTEINEVMVFCKLQFNAYNCFDKFISYVEAARKSVNVCMPSIHNPAIQGRLVQLLIKKGIKVRIIIDRNGYNESTSFFLNELIDMGAEIKCKVNGAYNIQHKFCIVDDMILMTGTLNWGDDRTSDHWNYVYITSKPQLVQPVNLEFNQMWNSYVEIQEAFKDSAVSSDTDETDRSTENEFEEANEQNQPQNELHETSYLRDVQTAPELCIM